MLIEWPSLGIRPSVSAASTWYLTLPGALLASVMVIVVAATLWIIIRAGLAKAQIEALRSDRDDQKFRADAEKQRADEADIKLEKATARIDVLESMTHGVPQLNEILTKLGEHNQIAVDVRTVAIRIERKLDEIRRRDDRRDQ